MIRRVFLILLLTIAAASCDPFWHLSATAQLPHPVPPMCARTSLLGLEGVDSVRVYEGAAQADSSLALTDFLLWSKKGYGWLTDRANLDGTGTLSTGWSWVGKEPVPDSVRYHEQLQAAMIRTVSHDCARIEPQITVHQSWQ